MAESRVVFLVVPVAGQPARIVMDGKTEATAIITMVEYKEGWYRATTASGGKYVGQVQAVPDKEVQQPQATQPEQAVTAQPLPTIPNTKPAQPENPVFGCIAAIVILVFIGAVFNAVIGIGNSLPSKTPSYTPSPSPSPSSYSSSEASSTPGKPAMDISDFTWKYGEYGTRYLVGTVTNNTNNTYGYVQVEFNLYDSSGAQVGSTMANVNNVEPHSTWKYEAIVMQDKATTARYKGITKF